MMKLLSSKTNSKHLLLCVFLGQLWGVTDSTTTPSSTATAVTQTTITTQTATTVTPVVRKALPSDVQNVTVVEQTESSITLKWKKVENIPTYFLFDHVRNKGENINQSNADISVSHVVSGLTAGTLYSFTLITVSDGGNSTGYNFKAATAPSNVENVDWITQTETSITLKWKKVNGSLNYILSYEGTEENITLLETQEEEDYVVSDLTAGKLYSFTLFTVLYGVNSTGHSFKAATAPSNVENVDWITQTETSITLKWKKVNGSLNYILSYEGTEENITLETQEEVVYVVSDLTAGKLYSFTLITVLYGVNSTGHNFKAATAPSNVENVDWITQNETSITLKWKKVNGSLNYILSYEGTEENITLLETQEEVVYVVSDLTAGKLYSFTLITVLYGVNSTGHNFKAATAPTNVENVEQTVRTETSITLKWKKVNDSLTYILSYNGTDKDITLEETREVFEVSGLTAGTLYNFTLIAVVNGVHSTGYNFSAVTKIDCARVDWHVTNSTIHGMVEGLFSNATATYESQTHVSLGDRNVSFTGLYPGATYEIHLQYKMNNTFYTQCHHKQTIHPPNLIAHCDYSGGGYSISIVLNVMTGVWTSVEVNVTGKHHLIKPKNETQPSLILPSFQPAKTYDVSVTLLSESVRSCEPFHFQCHSDPRGVIAGAVCAALLFCILVCLAIFIFLKRPDIISRKKSFISGSKQSNKEAKAISAAKFSDHFNQLSLDENRGFSQEYEDLSTVGTDQTRRASLLPENKVKNRFTNVLPYDWCRVKLTSSDPSGTSDYINANYMPGYNSNREYIATQGPLPSTVNDFWRMVWEQRVTGIVMVTNCTEGGRTKCEQYWPTDSQPCLYGELVVHSRSEQQEANWTLREFRVKHKHTSQERTVKHFHFTAWPDHGVPQCTEVLIQFRGLVRQHIEKEGSGSPTVVHCSAGVGRTGTIIALDVLLQQLQNQQAVGINAFVHKMRLNRPHMVQTESQYVFLHQCIMDRLQPKEIPEENLYENVDMIYVNATALREFHKSKIDY